jgi:hypothetical protein
MEEEGEIGSARSKDLREINCDANMYVLTYSGC